MTELIHEYTETLEKQWQITKDTWFLLFEFVEVDDMARDRKNKAYWFLFVSKKKWI